MYGDQNAPLESSYNRVGVHRSVTVNCFSRSSKKGQDKASPWWKFRWSKYREFMDAAPKTTMKSSRSRFLFMYGSQRLGDDEPRGSWFEINILESMGACQYKDIVLPVYDSHYKNKTVSRPSYL